MTPQLQVAVGQYSDKGRKPLNQDFHAVMIPREPLLSSKGIAVALADGISSSNVSQVASETSVTSFLQDYYATSESWSVSNSVQRVLHASNSWLYTQTRSSPYRYELDRGYVCTFSAMVLKATTAHIFHAGDTRVYRLNGGGLEQLTEDHRVWVSRDKSYLSRALGMGQRIDIDYLSTPVESGDTFVLATDGVYEFADADFLASTIGEHPDDLDRAAQLAVEKALENGSDDNLTIQILRVEQTPQHAIGELHSRANMLPFPPNLTARMAFDGYRILRELHHSHRSHVYLAVDEDSGEQVALKVPSVDRRDDDTYLESFLMEEWVARRIDNAHVLKPSRQQRKRNYLYIVTEYIEGQTLAQWMRDNPQPDLETVRDIIGQVANGLQALHRQEMLHQDLRPANVMIDRQGVARIIDLGAVRVAGVAESATGQAVGHPPGTLQYMAPEYFLGEPGSRASDLFSLGVIAYQMLSNRLPYGANIPRAGSRAAQRRLNYQSVLDARRSIPNWVDATLRKAVQIEPHKRYQELSEFTWDLRNPNPQYLRQERPPLIERNPLAFWKGLSLILTALTLALLFTHPLLE